MKTKIPPPIVALVFAGMMWLASAYVAIGLFTLPFFGQWWLPACLAGGGLGVMIAGLRAFRQSATTINPLKPEEATTLVISGVYTRTRNPMYLGMLLILTGIGVFLGSIVAILLLPFFVIYMNLFQITPEEQALTELFGDPYTNYLTNVRRWI